MNPPTFLTVSQFVQKHPAFTELALRNYIFQARPRTCSRGYIEGNGLEASGALIRIGRKILIDEEKFFEWIASQNTRAA